MQGPDIGYLVPQFPGQTHGFFWREILELEKSGAAVHVLSTRRPRSGIVSHEWAPCAIERTTYLTVPMFRSLLAAVSPSAFRFLKGSDAPELKYALPLLPYAFDLVRICRSRNIDHVHVHFCGKAALLAAMARCLGGPSYSMTLHARLSHFGPEQDFKWRHADFCIVVTDTLMKEVNGELSENLPARLVRQPMGVDTDFFRRETAYIPYSEVGPLKLFSCGRLNKGKGHQDTLQALRILLDKGLDVDLRIAGEDEKGGKGFRKQLETDIVRLRLQEHVTLLGAVSADKIRSTLLASHVFVLPSRDEALGVAFMEAMSCEVPTIGADVGGVSELIRDGIDGILVPPIDAPALTAAILALASHPERAATLGRQGRTRVIEKFAARRSAEVLLEEISRTQR